VKGKEIMRRTYKLRVPTLLLLLVIQILASLLLWLYPPIAVQAHAATSITPTPGAGSLGTTVTQNGNVYGIIGGKTVGTSLFHGFGEFGVATGDIAQFQTSNFIANPAMSNILGRVTGGNPSAIFGTIDSATYYPSANLFLMNPAGFLFGPNATVNVGGMMHATTADYLKLADGNLFKASPNIAADAVLTTSPVASFGFLGSNPAAISIVGSNLQVAEGKSLSFVGGNQGFTATDPDTGNPISIPEGITLTGAQLSASGGQINLASVASPGEIMTGTLAHAPNINGQSFGNLGAIQISEQSVIDVSGNGGGTVLIRGGQFLLDNSTISANVTSPGRVVNGAESVGRGIDIEASHNTVIQNAAVLETNVSGNATPGFQYGDVHVNADNIEISGSQDFETFPFTGIRSNIAERSTGGNSGNITLEADSILVQDLGTFSTIIESITGGVGNSGNIVLNGITAVHIDGATIQTMTQSATGNAGNITVSSPSGDISLTNFPFIQSVSDSGSGNAGDITFVAQNNISMQAPFIVGETDFGTGSTGNISISSITGNISLTDGPFITLQSFISSGNVGNINLSAPAGNILIAGGTEPGTGGAVFTAFRPLGGGDLNQPLPDQPLPGGGQINITGKNVTLRSSGIQADNLSLVEPGNITINILGTLTVAGTISNLDGTLFTANISTRSRGPANSGDLNIVAHDITLTDNGYLSTEAYRAGNGGALQIVTQDLQLTNGGQLRSGSTILIDPIGIVPPSTPTGAGGTITVQGQAGPTDSVLIDGSGSGISTKTELSGAGGSVFLNVNSLTIQNGGTISAATNGTTASATGGTITINAEHVALNSQAIITAETNGIAPAGVVDIHTGALAINSGGQIRSSSGAETQQHRTLALSPAPAQPLTGGTITIQGRTGTGSQADTVTIDGAGSGVFTESTGSRPGGDINLLTSQSVAMTNGAHISASSTGTGNAGNIQINAGNQLAMNGSSVTTEANQASGGAIKITTTPSGTVELTDSTITASVLDGTGGGGSVDIDPQFVILQNSQILANSVFGPGGNISITTNLLLPDTTSVISASSQFGQQGTIVIQSPVSPASGKLVPLGQKPLIATALVSQRCAALAGGNASSFTVAGRDSLPAEPGGWVSSPLALSMAESNEGPATETALSRLSEMAEETPLLSLRKVAPAGFLTQNFGAASSDCQS
jgi:filamentous hemagglutinin family protein